MEHPTSCSCVLSGYLLSYAVSSVLLFFPVLFRAFIPPPASPSVKVERSHASLVLAARLLPARCPPLPLAPPYSGPSYKCVGTKYFSEFRSGNAWARVQQKYVKTPNNGRTVHEYSRDGRMARAVMIFPKGVKGKTTIKKPGGWPQAQYAGARADSWYVMTSNDGCGKALFDSGGGSLNPGEWNVYLSRTTFKAENGVYFETYPNDRDSNRKYYKTWGGSNITVGMVDEFWGQDFFRDNGCVGEGEPMPIANTDIKARIAYDISGEGNT